ncbi:MAG: carbohydrate ABC transporter permease, partial [Pseudomonadota bacterium]
MISRNYNPWPMMIMLGLLTGPLALMYVYLFVDTVTNTAPGSLIPNEFTLEHWSFLTHDIQGRANIWAVTLNTFIFAATHTAVVLSVSMTAGYALSRLNVPFRGFFLAGVM